jgi:hypothetical protein
MKPTHSWMETKDALKKRIKELEKQVGGKNGVGGRK